MHCSAAPLMLFRFQGTPSTLLMGTLPRKFLMHPDPAYLQHTSIFRNAKTWFLQQGSPIFEPRQHRQGNSIALTEQLHCLADEHRDILFLSHDVWWNYSNISEKEAFGYCRLPIARHTVELTSLCLTEIIWQLLPF